MQKNKVLHFTFQTAKNTPSLNQDLGLQRHSRLQKITGVRYINGKQSLQHSKLTISNVISWTLHGNVTWWTAPCTEKDITEGTTLRQGSRRPQTSWLDNITAWIGLLVHSALHVEGEHRWVCDAVNPRTEHD